MKILFLGSVICVCILARDYGLGRHKILAGGPVELETPKGFSKVSDTQFVDIPLTGTMRLRISRFLWQERLYTMPHPWHSKRL